MHTQPTVLSITQTRAAEQAAVDAGSSFAQLMETAGTAATQALLQRPANLQRVWILCGKGNNGGDGLVMARLLAQAGIHVTVSLVQDTVSTDLAAQNLAALPASVVVQAAALAVLAEYDCIIDAVFGIGFDGELSADLQALLHACSQRPALRVALDIPSGINADSGHIAAHSFQADVCYVFHSFKPAHTMPAVQKYCGEIEVLDIGM
ncbi:NAD(P)H-hydrate epimerase [Vitreoscilla massiliensis]|uniref:NAD(P)H-hydrate epimerase n=1 Tax=Vitreoscilla massiliensis TaxID=1689272 RepID=A0ABY4E690_9NEIS|nr:NAD(P)H-hydrate epimerase [Vitreoscilla massiliensis]UOO90890.1 NAD(P)H-hydrate epimerase [Vitreoscilla massiliensis]